MIVTILRVITWFKSQPRSQSSFLFRIRKNFKVVMHEHYEPIYLFTMRKTWLFHAIYKIGWEILQGWPVVRPITNIGWFLAESLCLSHFFSIFLRMFLSILYIFKIFKKSEVVLYCLVNSTSANNIQVKGWSTVL